MNLKIIIKHWEGVNGFYNQFYRGGFYGWSTIQLDAILIDDKYSKKIESYVFKVDEIFQIRKDISKEEDNWVISIIEEAFEGINPFVDFDLYDDNVEVPHNQINKVTIEVEHMSFTKMHKWLYREIKDRVSQYLNKNGYKYDSLSKVNIKSKDKDNKVFDRTEFINLKKESE